MERLQSSSSEEEDGKATVQLRSGGWKGCSPVVQKRRMERLCPVQKRRMERMQSSSSEEEDGKAAVQYFGR
jgi:hypothetical protein